MIAFSHIFLNLHRSFRTFQKHIRLFDHIPLLATDNSSVPATDDYLDTRLKFFFFEENQAILVCVAWHKGTMIFADVFEKMADVLRVRRNVTQKVCFKTIYHSSFS